MKYKELKDVNIPGLSNAQAFMTQCGIQIILSIDNTPYEQLRHVSLSRKDRYPTWEEIKEVRDRFFDPTMTVAQILPRKEYYVNLHENCFHLWQLPFSWEMW